MRLHITSLRFSKMIAFLFFLFSINQSVSQPACPPGSYCFTNAGATGSSGPAQVDLDAEYAGTNLAGQVTSNNGIQEWIVPASGLYLIEAYGAQGYGQFGGRGAYMSGEFQLNANDQLKILVGQEGTCCVGSGTNQHGGGGGTFVSDINDNPLIVAGGGGGSWANSFTSTTDASINTAGNAGANGSTTGAGGTNGNGGMQGNSADGGGGFYGDGDGTAGGTAFVNGGTGGTGATNGTEGGFGGGGGGSSWNNRRGGGGGGYSGGGGSDGGSTTGVPEGGGGGSFNSGAEQINLPGENIGHGLVVISPLPSNAANDAGAVSIDSPNVFCPGVHDVVVTVQNYGTNPVDSVDIEWSINGIPQPSLTYTGTLDTIGGTGNSSTQLNIGSFPFSNAAYDVKVWTSAPNSVVDTVNQNDTSSAVIQSGILPPSSLSVSNISGDSAFLSWTPGSASNNFIYAVVPQGEPPLGGTLVSTDTTTVSGLSPLTKYDVYVREVCSNGADTSSWSDPVSFISGYHCPEKAYCFTNANATGRFGPSQTDIDNAYNGTNLGGRVTSNSGIQEWKVPYSGIYRVSAFGAEGGYQPGNTAPAGLGAKMSGEFQFNDNDKLLILVGQKGAPASSSGGSGGGGTFVTYDDNTPLIIAGGGSGAPNNNNYGELNGKITNRGDVGGAGSTSTSGSGGGGGFSSFGGGPNGGRPFTSGGAGGDGSFQENTHGGFGGGGGNGSATFGSDGGGGGGYSGGDYTFAAGTYGGGGSYNIGSDQVNKEGVKHDHGLVIIEPVDLDVDYDVEVVSIDAPAGEFCPGNHPVVATIANNSPIAVDSVKIHWQVDGVFQSTVHHKGLIDTVKLYGSDHLMQINLGVINFSANPHNIVVWTSDPNGEADSAPENDTLSVMRGWSVSRPSDVYNTSVSPGHVAFDWTPSDSTASWSYALVDQGQPPTGGVPVSQDSVVITGPEKGKFYDFYVQEICQGGGVSPWTDPVSVYIPRDCPGTGSTYCFTPAGAAGHLGQTDPSQIFLYYLGTNLSGEVSSIYPGIQEWTVPESGIYEIIGAGAGFDAARYQRGAVVSGVFELDSGDVLRIAPGQIGEHALCGSGGSFVTKVVSSGDVMFDNVEVEPLIIAGGAGGGMASGDATDVNTGGRSYTFGNGSGGITSGGGCRSQPGAGYSGDGSNGCFDIPESFLSGGKGGITVGGNFEGGFPCGGGGNFYTGSFYRGGGGGYTGGNTYSSRAEGGYSYNSGIGHKGADASQSGDGYVMVRKIEPTECVSPAAFSFIDSTHNSLSFSWVEYGSSQSWQVSYGSPGHLPGQGMGMYNANDTIDTLTGLSPETTYELFVRSVCDTNTYSDWSGPYRVTLRCTPLAGNYTIDGGQPTFARNFNSFTDAAQRLKNCGISSSVHFDVAPGIYNERVDIDSINGTSAVDTILFRGHSPEFTKLVYESNYPDGVHTLRLSYVSHVTFEGLTIEADNNGDRGWAMWIDDYAHHIAVEKCIFKTKKITSSANNHYYGLRADKINSSLQGVSDIRIEDCTFIGGRENISLDLSANANVLVKNNKCMDARDGIIISRASNVIVSQNKITPALGHTFGSGIGLSSCLDFQVTRNHIVHAPRRGISITNNSGGSLAAPSLIANNVIAKIQYQSSLAYGIYLSTSSSSYPIDVFYNSVLIDGSNGSALYSRVNPDTVIRAMNNSLGYINTVGGSSDGVPLNVYYFSSRNEFKILDYNNYHTIGNYIAKYPGNKTGLADLQAVNIPAGNDQNSVAGHPIYYSNETLFPVGPILQDAGTPVSTVTTDFFGNPRDSVNPDIGAYEVGTFSGDLELSFAEYIQSPCMSNNDSAYFTVENILGSTVDFSNDNLTLNWEVNGPVNSSGTIVHDSGILQSGESVILKTGGVDLSKVGYYYLSAEIELNAVNHYPLTNTLDTAVLFEVKSNFEVSPEIDTIRIPEDTLHLQAVSANFPYTDFFMTEVCHRLFSFGKPPGGFPDWLKTENYIEITGVPNSDLGGFTLQQWQNTLTGSYTFPVGTKLNSNGTAIIAVGDIKNSTPDHSNYYYHGNGSFSGTFGYQDPVGRVLIDPAGNIVDAVAYPGTSTFSFPAAAGVTTGDWSGSLPPMGNATGMRLEGPDDNTPNNWIYSTTSTNPQNPNELNQGVPLPELSPFQGFTWSVDGIVIDTVPRIKMPAHLNNGAKEFIAEYNSQCGILKDTSRIYFDFITAAVSSFSHPKCSGANDGHISVFVEGGSPPYTISWSHSRFISGTDAYNLPAGTYTITATDTNNVSDTLIITLNDNLDFNLTSDVEPASCVGNDGEITALITGTSGPYSYYWSTGDTGNTVTGLQGGNNYGVTVTDSKGCELTDSAAVPHADTIPPEVMANNITTYLTPSGIVQIQVSEIDAGSWDSCGIDTMFLSKYEFDCSNVGVTSVILTVEDIAGNTGHDTAQITVSDTASPDAIIQNHTAYLNANGQASITASDIDNGSSDNCGIDSMVLSRYNFSCSDTGVNNITFTVYDESGNFDEAQAQVTVIDTSAPIVLTQNINVYLDPNTLQAGISVNEIDNGTSDNCGIASLTLSKTGFNCSDVGIDTITLTAVDISGNSASAAAEVTVHDTVGPLVTAQNLTAYLDASGQASVTPNDIDDGSFDDCGIANMSLSQTAFTCADTGANTVTLTATDIGGNSSADQAQVTVLDTVKPQVAVQNISVYLDASGQASVTTSDINNGSSDNCGIDQLTLSGQSQYTCVDTGTHTVTLIAMDHSGNTSSAQSQVTVLDTASPNVNTQNLTVYLDASGQGSISVTDIDNGTSDNCAIDQLSLDQTAFTCGDTGLQVVTLTAVDVSGNTASGSANVMILDTIAPQVVTQGITVYLDGSGTATIGFNDIDGGSTDNCGIDSNMLSQTQFDCSDTGVQSITLTIWDESGNADSAVAQVTVSDTSAPALTVQNVTLYIDSTGTINLDPNAAAVSLGDNCSVDSLWASHEVFDCQFADSAVEVVVYARDPSGNTTSSISLVTIEDTLAPVVNVQDIAVYLDGNGEVNLIPSDVDAGTTDNCGIESMNLNLNYIDCSSTGDTVTVVLTVEDVSGNVNSDTAFVTVWDTSAPVISSIDTVSLYLSATGTAALTIQDIQATVDENCGAYSDSLSRTSFSCSDQGLVIIEYVARDSSGNTSVETVPVKVIDTHNTISGLSGDHGVEVNKTVTYTADSLPNVTYDWTVTGGNIDVVDVNKCTVTWGGGSQGILELEQTNQYGCVDRHVINVELWPVSVEEFPENKYDFTLYPNPARTVIHIKLTRGFAEGVKFDIYDYAGNLVEKGRINELSGKEGKPVNISRYAKGLYFMRIRVGDDVRVLRFTVM